MPVRPVYFGARPAPVFVRSPTKVVPRASRTKRMWKTCSSFFNDRGRGDGHLLKLRLIGKNMNAHFRDGEEWLSVFEFGDGFTKRGKIRLRQIDQPIELGPGCELILFEVGIA